MKTLYIVRHAKSSWDDPALDDRERPLNERGEKDAPRMGKRLKDRGVSPALLLTSPAVRAAETCRIIAKALGYPQQDVHVEPQLYHAGRRSIMAVVAGLENRYKSVMIFGHNPGLTDFVNMLLDEDIDNIPTCGVVGAELDIDQWRYAKAGCGSLDFFDYPKRDKHK